jgi:hypothetical protein
MRTVSKPKKHTTSPPRSSLQNVACATFAGAELQGYVPPTVIENAAGGV